MSDEAQVPEEKSLAQKMDERKFLTAAEVQETPLRVKELQLPDSNGWVRIMEIRGRQRDQFERLVAAGRKKNDDFRGMRAKVVMWSLVNEDRSLMFTNEKDLDELGAKATNYLFDEVLEFNGMNKDAVSDAEGN